LSVRINLVVTLPSMAFKPRRRHPNGATVHSL